MTGQHVIMAARQAQRFIEYAVESLQQQTVPVGLHIAVDACPDTAKKLDALGVPYWWYGERQVGPYILRNSLIAKLPEASHYHIFDADDIADPHHCETLARAAGEDGIAGPSGHEWSGLGKCPVETVRHSGNYRRFAGGRPTIARAVWERLGGFREQRTGCDSDLQWRARAVGIRVTPVEEPTLIMRRHRNAQTRHPSTNFRSPYRRECVAFFRQRLAAGEYVVKPVTVDMEFRG